LVARCLPMVMRVARGYAGRDVAGRAFRLPRMRGGGGLPEWERQVLRWRLGVRSERFGPKQATNAAGAAGEDRHSRDSCQRREESGKEERHPRACG
jgi:hypothetical protein